jgi:hypothetical protein
MLAMALQFKVVLAVVRLHSPEIRALRCCRIMKKLIFMLACSRVITGKIS